MASPYGPGPPPLHRIAVWASGGGSNFVQLAHHFAQAPASAVGQVVLLVANIPNSLPLPNAPDRVGALKQAAKLGIQTLTFTNAEAADGPHVLALLRAYGITAILLAGYLRKVPSEVVEAFEGAILNIHPALLPAFGGKGMYGKNVHQAVLAANAQTTGPTIHAVTAHYDEGSILAQADCPVLPTDTPETLAARVLALEHELYGPTAETYLANVLPLIR